MLRNKSWLILGTVFANRNISNGKRENGETKKDERNVEGNHHKLHARTLFRRIKKQKKTKKTKKKRRTHTKKYIK